MPKPKLLNALKYLTEQDAFKILQRLSGVNPLYLGRFFGKIKPVKYIPTPTSDPDLPGMCWLWTGAVDESKGTTYPKMKVAGKTRRAHRWIFQIIVRALGPHEDAHHLCENAMCCNPWHLQASDSVKHSGRGPPSNWNGSYDPPTDQEIPF